MNDVFTGTRFDGNTLAGRPVTVRLEAGRFYVTDPGPVADYSLAAVRVSDRLAQVPRFLYLPDRSIVESADNDVIDALLPLRHRGRVGPLVHWLEIRARVAAAATVLLVVSVSAIVYFGLPVLAERAAFAVPPAVEAQAGRVTLATFDRFLRPSQLGPEERLRVTRLLDRVVHARVGQRDVRVIFRSMGGKYPNAFALPGGTIVVSDEMVQLASSDEELMAVLAHELGHIERRHGLQSVLRGSAALLVVCSVTGDLSTLTSFSGTIPFTLLQRGYSREFETEADDYALTVLRAAKVDPWYFTSILGKLEGSRAGAGADYSYLSTHPSSADRIKRINPDGHRPARVRLADGEALMAHGFATDAPVDLALPGRESAADSGDVRPRPLIETPPAYPGELSRTGVEGTVTVEFVINPEGKVEKPRVVTSTNQGFEAAALAAVTQWKFTPGRHHGHLVSVRSLINIEFNLNDHEAYRPNKPGAGLSIMMSDVTTTVPPSPGDPPRQAAVAGMSIAISTTTTTVPPSSGENKAPSPQ